MGPKRNISFTKPPEPAFIKRMKESIGYQELPNIETKKEKSEYEDNDLELEDEKPVLVILDTEDITKNDIEAYTAEKSEEERVVFSKPKKLDEKNSLDCSSKKSNLQKRVDSLKESNKAVKNSSLLSFDEDEDY